MTKAPRPKILGIIPARYESTRFPGKMLALIRGKTLIQRTFENAKQCPIFDELIVATDDLRIAEHVTNFGGRAVMTSTHCQTGSDRLAEALENTPDLRNYPLIINIQGDEPCISLKTIESIGQLLIENPEAVMSTAVVKLTTEAQAHDRSIPKCVFDQKGNALYFSRSLLPSNHKGEYLPEAAYYGHLGIYGFRQEFLKCFGKLPATPLQLREDLEQLKVLEHGYCIKVAVAEEFNIGVNYPEDIKKVEQSILCKQNSFSLQAESVRH